MRTERPTTHGSGGFSTLEDLVCAVADLLRPPERLTVSQAAERYIHLNQSGAYVGPYRVRTAPYMRQPMDTLASREFSACVFVGPAQTGKTESLLLGWLAYSVCVDPMDMILYNPSQAAARDFSMRRIDRLHRNSRAVGEKLMKRRDADNVLDKHYTNGMLLTLSYPSVNEMAGRPVGRVALTDLDRMDDDIDGEGSPFDLAQKRTTTFQSFAMTLAESSPSRPVTNPKWVRTSPHEAPPCDGILGLYNRGTRNLWYWPCPRCGEHFSGNFHHLRWDTGLADPVLAGETVHMECPVCGGSIWPHERDAMQQAGLWLADGQRIGRDGTVHGAARRSPVASFWLRGTAAAFVTWPKLLQSYLLALQDYERTASEDSLKKFFNTDEGAPYLKPNTDTGRLPEALKSRAEPVPEREVPDDVRMLLATIDVQKNCFVVQVHGVSPGTPYDVTIIDRFSIFKSERLDEEEERLWVKPGSYLADWRVLIDGVLKKTYPLADGSGRRMQIRMAACDSGGKAGVTAMAYNFWRELKAEGMGGRFHLVKGVGSAGVPRVRIDYPDSGRKDRMAGARGDVPVLLLNSNALKDEVANRLECITPGRGQIRFPDWLPDWFYAELCCEVLTDKGWQNPAKARNEAWDLLYYCLGLGHSAVLRLDKIDWKEPPGWAAPWASNLMVLQANQDERFAMKPKSEYDFASLGEALA